MEKAEGMFRWVQCQMDRLNGCWSAGDVRDVLGTLPATLNETYERMLHAIVKKEFGGRVARTALIWLVTALRPLRLSQLAEAVAINCDNPALDTTIAPIHETDILEICGSLVSYDKWTEVITLSHSSVKEYLTSDASTDKPYFVDHPRASLQLASVSIHSIVLLVRPPNYIPEECDLVQYAVSSGFEHLANCAPEPNDRLLGLLRTLQNHISMHCHSYANQWTFPKWITRIPQLALYIIIRFGHPSMLRHYLDRHSVQSTKGDNPLVYAALYGDVLRVQMLLDKGLDVNLEATVHGTHHKPLPPMLPLIAATHNRTLEYPEELLKLLLAQECTIPRDTIHLVFRNRTGLCKPSIIHILLEHGADGMLLDARGNNCLHALLQNWNLPQNRDIIPSDDLLELVRSLLGAGCNPALLNDEGISPFHLAISSACVPVIQYLIENGFRLPPDAILHVAKGCSPPKQLPMVQMLVDHGIAVNVWDGAGCNALHILLQTSIGFHETSEVACELLAAGCDINRRNHFGETPIHLAAQWHTLHLVELLIDHGAQLPADIVNYAARNSSGKHDPTTLMTLLVRLVKTHDASCQALTVRGSNALHNLMRLEVSSREPMEECLFLLENGCDFYAINSFGITPLGIAIENGHLSIARTFLARAAQPHADITGSHCADVPGGDGLLHRLCYKLVLNTITYKDFMERADLLQEAGYDLGKHVNMPNNQGFTPLCIVLRCIEHRPAIILYLVDAGAKFSDVNPLFLDNFQWASHLAWHRDATEVYERALARPKLTFGDVARVCRLLTDSCKLPLPITRSILDMAEYWAHKEVIRSNIRYTTTRGSDPIAFPVTPNEARCWIPRRVMFSCKLLVDIHTPSHALLSRLLIKRQNAVYALPYLDLSMQRTPPDPPKTAFDVWDDRKVAIKLNWRHQLAVGDLRPGDALSVELFDSHPEELELEFFQIDMYFAMRSTDPLTSLESN